jgi:hypothetical protein
MRELQAGVEADVSLMEPIDRVVHCAIASLFYFELSEMPSCQDGKYIGVGIISCSISGDDPAFQLLLNRLASRRAQLYVNEEPISDAWDASTSCNENGNFCRPVRYETGDQISISICMGGSSARGAHISGLPSTVADLVDAQGLNAYFGTSEHRKRKRSTGDDARSAKKRRLKGDSGKDMYNRASDLVHIGASDEERPIERRSVNTSR